MEQSIQSWFAGGLAIYYLATTSPTGAQIVPDATLPVNSNVTLQSNTSILTGGTVAGSTLFHSFEQFSVPTGSTAYFNNALEIQNIISRVTGSSISTIDGSIRANGIANLFLLNPNGIIFGSNARLNVGGSFLASTASALNFADGTVFSATASQGTPLLTVSVPIGLQYGGNAGNVQVQGAHLGVTPGQTLALVGGNVSIDGGILQASGGHIELGGLAGEGTVGLSLDNNSLRLSFPNDVARADVFLANAARVLVAAGGGGSIAINARNIELLGGSGLVAGIGPGLGAVDSQAGNIEINATDKVSITGTSSTGLFSSIVNAVFPGAIGNAGDINIQARSLSVANGAQVVASTRGQGNAGSIIITASDTVSFDDIAFNRSSIASSTVERGAVGNGGNINITTGSLSVTNGAQLLTLTRGQGNAGHVTLTAMNTISFDGVGTNARSSAAFSTVEAGAVGQGGDIDITTRSLSVTNGAVLTSRTNGQGYAGNVSIRATDTVSLDGVGRDGNSSVILSTVGSAGVGQGGSIDIMAGSLSVSNGAQVVASTRGQGNAGSVTLTATDTISFDGFNSAAFSTVEQGAVGNGGSINITTQSFFLSDRAELLAYTRGQGDAGSVAIRATDTVSFTNGVGLAVTSEGSNNTAGDIEVEARSIRLDDRAVLSAETQGGQGNIRLRSQDLVLRRASRITTDATGTAIGGNITLNTDVLAALENSDIRANAEESFGGRVIINARGIFGTEFREAETPESDITASSALGPQFSGTVEINTPDVDPSQGLAELPSNLANAEGLIDRRCSPGGIALRSSFVITGRGGIPSSPTDPLENDAIMSTWVSLNSEEENLDDSEIDANFTGAAPKRLVEAQGWAIGSQGEVILTAHPATFIPHGSWSTFPSC